MRPRLCQIPQAKRTPLCLVTQQFLNVQPRLLCCCANPQISNHNIYLYIYIHLIYSWHMIMVSLKTLNLFLWAISPYIDRYGSFYDPKLGESYTQWPTSSTRPAILAQPYLPVQMDWCVWKPIRSKCFFFLRSYTIFLLKFPCHVINSVPIFGENHPKSTTELDSLQQILVLSYKVTFMVKTC